jgi:chromosome segregation protein
MPRILRLDRMEIHGFKSFYGRTRFDFPNGITAVVGPNGCGKSNIGDAISWVLGEQKASSLRSDRMEDVIFNGSEGRRPLGMAEVSLHFKNLLSGDDTGVPGNGHPANGNGHSAAAVEEAVTPPIRGDHTVPIVEAAEVLRITGIEAIPEQVVVTRRIYRSGESEYILNGERCRLKDIQDLLAKTDIGSRLYSTIEQGKIDQVLAAKPKDRRAMFEEAAGILGYRSKRRQAELKLEAAQANLLRINDIVVEVEKQINTLRRQAAKARRYQRLVDDLKERRLALLRHRLAAADGERAETGCAIEALRADEVARAVALSADEAELERLRLLLDEGEAQARRRREEIHAFDLEIDRIQERLRAGQDQVRDLESRLAEGGHEMAALRARLLEQEERLAATRADLEAIEERLSASRSSTAAVAIDDGERATVIEAREAELEAARAGLLERVETIAAMTRRGASLEDQVRVARSALDRIGCEVADLGVSRERAASEAEALEREAEAGHDRARVRAVEHEAATEAALSAGERLGAAEKRAEELKGRAAVLAERLAALAEMERQHAGFSEGVGDILKGASGLTPRGVVGDRLEVPRGLEKAVEATLGDLLEAVLVGGTQDAVRGVAYLRGSARGRVSFVAEEIASAPADPSAGGPADADRLSGKIGGAPDGPIARILERTLLVEDLDQAFRLHAADPAFAYVTPQGDIVRLDGSATGGDGRALQHWLLQRRAEKEESARRMSETAAAIEDAETSFVRLREDQAEAQERLKSAALAVQDEARLAFERELKLQQARAQTDRIDRALPLLQSERARLERDIATWGGEVTALAEDLTALHDARRAVEEAIQSKGAEILALRAELDRVRRESSEARAVLAAAEERRQSLARERDGLGGMVDDLKGSIARRGREIDEWTQRVAQIRGQESSLEPQRQAALQARAEAAARDEAAHAGLAYERGLLLAREQAVKEGRAAQVVLRERQQQHELRRARAEADLEHLERSCRDELATTLELLRASPAPPLDGPGLEEREAETQRIRADIESIGPVNLMAVEQQKDLEERFAFLSAQKQDLEEAIASLRDSIRTINREARERFKGAFAAIQENFQEGFKTLFGGGTAELRLSEGEEDVLEAGIEIVAQPPGKRLQKIGLLSGGEKALTAVALLVALFRYRPSPFCILDEVDAPLDEANVERFTRLLQQLRSDTQFILITHNRKSMEAADLLYGVTMEEPGVSKILPLRFE